MKPNPAKLRSIEELQNLMDEEITKGIKPKAVTVEKTTIAKGPNDLPKEGLDEGAEGFVPDPISEDRSEDSEMEEGENGGGHTVTVTDEEIQALESLLQKAT